MKCPGQDLQYWKPGDIYDVPCPKCGKNVEFFKDETARRCSACGHRFVNPSLDFGCAAYCPFAEQCIGALPEEAAAVRENLLKDRVAVAMKRHYRQDFHRIGRAVRRARWIERLGRESQAPLAVMLIVAYLRDMSTAEAQQLLTSLSAREELITQAIALLTNETVPSTEPLALVADLLADAETLVSWEDTPAGSDGERQMRLQKLQNTLRTEAGRHEAQALLAG